MSSFAVLGQGPKGDTGPPGPPGANGVVHQDVQTLDFLLNLDEGYGVSAVIDGTERNLPYHPFTPVLEQVHNYCVWPYPSGDLTLDCWTLRTYGSTDWPSLLHCYNATGSFGASGDFYQWQNEGSAPSPFTTERLVLKGNVGSATVYVFVTAVTVKWTLRMGRWIAELQGTVFAVASDEPLEAGTYAPSVIDCTIAENAVDAAFPTDFGLKVDLAN